MPMAEGLQPEDIVHQAVAKTIDGSLNGPGRHRRPWDGQRDLFDHLTSVIDSETSNLAEGWSNQRFRRAELLNSNLDDDSAIGFFDSQPDTTGLSPEGYALQTEKEARAERFVWGFLESLEGEKILLSITEEILDGATKPGEIASALGIPVAEVYAAKKRLKRRLSEYRLNVSTTEEVING